MAEPRKFIEDWLAGAVRTWRVSAALRGSAARQGTSGCSPSLRPAWTASGVARTPAGTLGCVWERSLVAGPRGAQLGVGLVHAVHSARGVAPFPPGRAIEVSAVAASPQQDPRRRSAWTGRDRGGTVAVLVLPHRVAVLDAVQGERWDVPASGCRAVTIQAAMEGASALPIRPVHATTRHRCNPFVARLPLGRAARPLRLPSQSTCGSAPRTVCPTPCECLQHMYHRPPTRTFQPRSKKTVQLLASLRDTRRTVCIVSRRFRGVRSKT